MLAKYTHSPIRAYLALGIGILSLGFSAIFVRWSEAPAVVTSFYRMLIGVTFLAIPFFLRVRKHKRLSRAGIGFAILGGLFFAADLALWTAGVQLSGATNPTLLSNTAPLWVGLGALLILKEKMSRPFWLGLALAMAGAILILGLDNLQGFELGLGSFFGLLSGFFYGGYFLAAQRGRETLGSMTFFWPAAVSSMLALLCVGVATGQPFTGFPAQTWWAFLGMGLVTQVIGYLAINDALGLLPASIVSPTMLGQPVITALLAGPLLGEVLTLWEIIGGVAVLAGVFIVHWSRNRRGK